MMKTDPTALLSEIAKSLDRIMRSVWRIVRKTIGLSPYKPKFIRTITSEHKTGRKSFYEWYLDQLEDFHKKSSVVGRKTVGSKITSKYVGRSVLETI